MNAQNRCYVAAALGASLFVMAGAGAMAFNEDTFAPALIEDVRVGERDGQTRIALFCRSACIAQARADGTFFMPGAGDDFDIDISAASARVLKLHAEPGAGGATISINHTGGLDKVAAKSCKVSGRDAACLDLYFAEKAKPVSIKTAPSQKQPKEKIENVSAKADSEESAEPKTSVPPAPTALRETADERLNAYAALSAPERLPAPKITPPILAKVQPIESSTPVEATPSLRTDSTFSPPVETTFAGRIEVLLGKSLSQAYCNNAEATLQTDAWALGSMVDVGLCAAARGDVVEAESMLSRLLEYTPDNYEALVGKAVIAEQAGEKGAALRYYQDALNAPPPVAESARIVEAMAALS